MVSPSPPVPVGERLASLAAAHAATVAPRVALVRANDTAARWNLFPMMVSHVILRPGRICFFRPHPAWVAEFGGPVSAKTRETAIPSQQELVCQLSELF